MYLKDFFRFYGKQEIVFSILPEKNVTIILGDNGIGKTTLLNAFYWGFYGDVTPPLSEDEMLNKMTKAQMLNDQIEDVLVEIEFEERGVTYYILRKQRWTKKNDEIKKSGPTELQVSFIDEKGNIQQISEQDDFFSSIIPKKLRSFFFFDGERIDRLAKIDGKEEIRKAILDILGLTNLELINKDLEDVKDEYLKEIKKYMKVDEVSLSDDYAVYKEEIRKLTEEINSLSDQKKAAMNNLEKLNRFLEANNFETVRTKQREREVLESSLGKLNTQLEDNRKNILLHISNNFKTYLISSKYNRVFTFLEEKRKKGELPSDIKQQFIQDLLQRQECICGAQLKPGTPEYDRLEQLKRVAGRSELDDAYSRLSAYIEYAQKKAVQFFPEYYDLLALRKRIEDDIEVKKDRINKISEELKSSPEEKIREYENLRANTLTDISTTDRKIGKLESDKTAVNRNLRKIESEIRAANLANEQAKKIQKQYTLADDLGKLNTEIRTFFIEATRRNLNNKINDVFGSLATKDYRKPLLSESFELGIVNKLDSEEKPVILSTGERQITSLSFIGSLVSYAREKESINILSDFGGGDFPIVMDSPFGNLDKDHTANVASGIGELASQVIIIVSSKQWSNEVAENIYYRVGKMYILKDGDFRNLAAVVRGGEYTVIKEENL